MVERKLTEISSEIARVRADLQVSSEQLEHFADEADEARIRALVSETPVAEHEFQEANRHADAMRRHHAELEDRLRALEARQDELLDQMTP